MWYVALFLVPAFASLVCWITKHRSRSWYGDDLSPTGVINGIIAEHEAAIYILCARTEGLKGGLALHAWIVTKEAGSKEFNRYDKVGWGSPIRKNEYAPDAKWYANHPQLIKVVKGQAATALIPKIEQVIADYPHASEGCYLAWPGPNSNSFIAHILRQVPELDAVLPANAVGRDYLAGGAMVHIAADRKDVTLSYRGLFGCAFGFRSGLELHFLGLVIGMDLAKMRFKVPGFGLLEIPGFLKLRKLSGWAEVRSVVQRESE